MSQNPLSGEEEDLARDNKDTSKMRTIIMKWTLTLIGTILVSFVQGQPLDPNSPLSDGSIMELSKQAAFEYYNEADQKRNL